MKRTFFILFLFLVGTYCIPAQTIAFTNVNVIPMDKERVLSNQTVIIRDGLITEIGDAKRIKISGDTQVIDGKGKYLIPGLSDMHVHLLSDEDEFPDSLAEDELKIMIANGVTTIRLMTGTPEQLVLREKSAKGEIIAPLIYASSPQFTGGKNESNAYVVSEPEPAREFVKKAKQDGYDYLKVTTAVKPEVYEAIVDEAKKQNMRVIGHADSRSFGLEMALKAGQPVEHLDGYLKMLLPADLLAEKKVSDIYVYQPKTWESIDYVDENKIPEIAKATVKSALFSTPTLFLFNHTFGIGRTEEEIRSQPDFRFFSPKNTAFWFGINKKYWATAASAERRAKYVALRNKITKAIYAAGGKILAGSDTPEWILLYGFTLHRELKAINEAGLSNYATLQTATKNPALFFGTSDKTGTIEKGKRADLVLLNANPLENISATENRAGVMVRGKYYTQTEMNKWLDEIAPRFYKAADAAK